MAFEIISQIVFKVRCEKLNKNNFMLGEEWEESQNWAKLRLSCSGNTLDN